MQLSLFTFFKKESISSLLFNIIYTMLFNNVIKRTDIPDLDKFIPQEWSLCRVSESNFWREEFHARRLSCGLRFFFLFSFRINAFSSPTIFPLLMEGIDRPAHNVLDDYRGRGSRKKSIYGRVTFTVVRKAPVTFESRAIDTLSAAQSTLIIIY